MSNSQRDPKTGRFVKSGASKDEMIADLKYRLSCSAQRVSDLEKVVKDQNALIDRLQLDVTESMASSINAESEDSCDSENHANGFMELVVWSIVIVLCFAFWAWVISLFGGGK